MKRSAGSSKICPERILRRSKQFMGLYTLLLLFLIAGCGNRKDHEQALDSALSKGKNAIELAREYGADDYGMKKYVMAFLYRGSDRTLDSIESAKLQTAHLQNISRLAEEGKLVLAGPFFGDGELRGIYIFNVQSIAEAEDLTNTDPAIQAGSLRMELFEWYGSAALMAVNEIHKTISKETP